MKDQNEVLLKLALSHERDEVFQGVIDYLTTAIPGSGCSIFLVNPSTDELNLVKSSNIDRSLWDKCTYKKGEGFTGWPFKFKELLYIPDESDSEFIRNIKPESPIHRGAEKGKTCETEILGPFMAAPIKSGDYVIGVIRLPAIKGEKKEYSKNEQELFLNFARSLAETIEHANLKEKHKKLVESIAKMTEQLTSDNLLQQIVEDVPTIVGGGGCSIFLREDTPKRKDKVRFYLRASTSTEPTFKQLINKYYYPTGGQGVTSWVATYGKSISLEDINDPTELERKAAIQRVNVPFHVKTPCEIQDVGPFLAVPIFQEEEVIGVIRIPRQIGSKPFDVNDETLLTVFANQLSYTLTNIRKKTTLEEFKTTRNNDFENKFSPKLIGKCRKISIIEYADEIRDFLNFPEKKSTIEEEIMNSLENLWVNKYGEKYDFPLLKDFKSYEELLLELPRYRDHFIHQYQVFLLGAYIIDRLYQLKLNPEYSSRSFADYYNQALNIQTTAGNIADSAWLITSTFHDVAYPIERSDELFNSFFSKFMDFDEKVVDKISLFKIISDHRYGKSIDQLCDFFIALEKGELPWKYNPSSLYNISVCDKIKEGIISSLVNKNDHGVLASLILLHQSKAGRDEYSSIIYPSALAIALHNTLLFDIDEEIKFEKNPLAFLLRYCDLIHEWGRDNAKTPEKPLLLDMNVDYDPTIKKIKVVTEIQLGSKWHASEKRKEAKRIFNKLKSNEIKFSLVINNNYEQVESYNWATK
jgi:GAF domain-containing protein